MATDETPEFTWQAHPARERVGAAVGGAVAIVAITAVIHISFQSLGWALLALAVLVVSLNRFFFRSRFRIDDEGIIARYPLRSQRLGWADIRRFVFDNNGGYLSTRARPSRLDAYRGLHVLFGSRRDDVIAQIRAHLPRKAAP